MPREISHERGLPRSLIAARKLIGFARNDFANQRLQAVFVSDEEIRQLVQQLGIRILDRPISGRRTVGIDSLEVPRVRWIDDARAKEITPEMIHDGQRELR